MSRVFTAVDTPVVCNDKYRGELRSLRRVAAHRQGLGAEVYELRGGFFYGLVHMCRAGGRVHRDTPNNLVHACVVMEKQFVRYICVRTTFRSHFGSRRLSSRVAHSSGATLGRTCVLCACACGARVRVSKTQAGSHVDSTTMGPPQRGGRRERRLRSFLRHERVAVAMDVAGYRSAQDLLSIPRWSHGSRRGRRGRGGSADCLVLFFHPASDC